jgi:outer membrane lipoprotein-sorting protein
MKKLMMLISLLVFLTTSAFAYTLKDLGVSVKNYQVLPFKQIAINAMSKQKIERSGTLTIKKAQYMIFKYNNGETLKLQNSKAYDTIGNNTKVYPLEGFNQVLYSLFLGKTDINSIFNIKKANDYFVLTPKEKTNIASVEIYPNNQKLKEIKITDIYGNIIIFDF